MSHQALPQRWIVFTFTMLSLAGCAGLRLDPTPSLTAIPPTATATSTLTHTPTATTTSTPKLAATPTPSTRQQAHTFTAQIASEDHMTRTVHLNYLLYLPKDYGATPQAKWPLILFLHGAGERGDNLNLVKKEGLPKIVDQREDFPFIVVSPQCPSSSWWSDETDALNALLDYIVTTCAVDLDRVYVTGLSMGGYGTWRLALEHPDRFAAIAPIAGGYNPFTHVVPENICELKNVPVWAFHGARDAVVPSSESKNMVAALKACGGDVKLTLYPDADHAESLEARVRRPDTVRVVP